MRYLRMASKTPWVSAVGPYLQSFLDWKRLAGYQFRPQERGLHQFDAFCADRAVGPADLTRPLLDAFCTGTGYESVSTGENRRRLLRQWADYLEQSGQGVVARPTPIPTPTRRSRYQPHIYTEQELRALFTVIDEWPSYPNTNRTLVDPVLFRMLYGCGIRLGEALRLTRDDVDRKTGVLRIRQGKNRKDRLVPMAAALTERCRSYDGRRVHAASAETAPFYPGQHGNVYDQSTIYRRFREYLWTAGISHSGAGPRIHDLRHTYCVHRLKVWVREGRDLTNLLPYLAVYLGHADFRGTEYYLRLTADLYPEMIATLERAHGAIIPPQEDHTHEIP